MRKRSGSTGRIDELWRRKTDRVEEGEKRVDVDIFMGSKRTPKSPIKEKENEIKGVMQE